MRLPVFVDPRIHDAVIFDLDGVVTDTATIHASAWKTVFDEYLAHRPPAEGEDHRVLSDADYRVFIDGKPRLDGVSDFLRSRGITLPHGNEDDFAQDSACGLANRKQRRFMELVAEGVPVFASTVELVRQLGAAGVRAGVFSSSRNCAEILEIAGLAAMFSVRVDGVDAVSLGLAGKPDPALLNETAKRLGVSAGRCVVVEDSIAGVQAGRNGGFGLVIGVDRTGNGGDLRHAGADVVVHDLVDVSIRGRFQRVSEMADALESYGEIATLVSTRQPVLLLDFDGTLSEIVDDPNAATVPPDIAKTLESLTAHCPVALISGRSLADIQNRVGVRGLWYGGSHGVELVTPEGVRYENSHFTAAVDRLQSATSELSTRLAGIEGVFLEDKHFAVAVHYRNVSSDRVDALTAVVRTIGQRRSLRVSTGRKVIELRPDVDWDKGKAVDWIMHRISDGGLALPIYIGDDATDEDAFDAVRQKGIGIAVRQASFDERRSAARYCLDDPHAVGEFLARLDTQLAEEQDDANNPWTLTFGGYERNAEKLREALCTLGNGYMAVRGAAPESEADQFHYPGFYIAGVYNRLSDEVAGHVVDNESMVNLPNWLPLTFRVDDGAWFDIDSVDVQSYLVTVDLRRATMCREFTVRDDAGRITRIEQHRLVAMHLHHVGATKMTVTAQNWSGRLEVRSLVDGAIRNDGVERYRDLSSRHVAITDMRETAGDSVLVLAETLQSRIRIAVAMRDSMYCHDPLVQAERRPIRRGSRIGHEFGVDLETGQSATIEKVVCVYTSRDHGAAEPAEAATRELQRVGHYAEIERLHHLAWAHLWERCTIEMGHDAEALRIVRLHQLHLMQTVSPHTADLDVGVPARGLHGEAYRGHVFWDELFVFPVTNMRLPKVTQSLLMYRYRRLPEARRAASEAGHAGAMFPWQSGSDGREESQRLHVNPRSGRWTPDASARAHHVGLAIAYNIWQYYQITGDIGFLIDFGAEMLADIAKFWVSMATFDASRDRYVIRGVVGPDEFHSGYPGREYEGIDNNAYTNVMAVWTILRAMEALERLPPYYRVALLETLGIGDEDLACWEDVSLRMFVPFHDGVLSQFEGYEDLAEFDWEGYRGRYDNLQRLDRILEAENDSVNNYKASKQADVLMLFYLLSADELYELFDRLGYRFEPDQIPRTIDYYDSRTSHGSTLSAVVHSWVMARGNRHQAMRYFEQALASDIVDIQRGTTAEGIHLAAMAGSIDLLQRCFTGLEIRRDRIVLGPLWPEPLGKLEFTFRYRGHRLHLGVIGRSARLSAEPSDAPPVVVECRGETQSLTAGGTVEFHG
jgi:trehalose-phosphatase